ncbi:MAG TPA: ABC transporter ATP-binding protein [Candidatus Pullilachnospira intestinigallinarum]|nr:ABC transporter ATP-binding protein [Candidatus Pullilachnospira intestinigallinarum]
MLLEAKNVLYSYKSNRDKIVLKNVSAAFGEATFYAIVGSSGSGKTTFLSLLAGLDHPVSGTILYNGEDIRKKGLNNHRKHNISLVFQNYNLIDYLTTEENVKLGGKKDAEKLLREVGIPGEDWKRNVLQLSGGQQQRVAIARALASEAKVLLADEPTGNLDEETADEIIDLLKKTAHELGKCVIVVTHSKHLAGEAEMRKKIKQNEKYPLPNAERCGMISHVETVVQHSSQKEETDEK